MVGDEANPLRQYLEIEYPIREGIIHNWDDMCALWEHSFFNTLKLPRDLKDHKILITEAAMNPKGHRKKMAEIMFEKFGFGHVYFQMQALCALYSEGKVTGLVLDSGDGVSHCIPVFEGVPFYNEIGRLNVAGRHVTDYLNKLLLIRGYAFNSTADFETLREIKESSCYVAYDISRDRKLAKETTVVEKEYNLPDNTSIFI
jgi:actin-related protein 2